MSDRFRHDLGRRVHTARMPAVIAVGGAALAWGSWVWLRWNVVSDVAAFSSLFVSMYAIDAFLEPPPGMRERGPRFEVDTIPALEQGGPVSDGQGQIR